MSADERKLLLALNCGSSSIKYAVFEAAGGSLPRKPWYSGKVEGVASPAATITEDDAEAEPLDLDPTEAFRDALMHIRRRVAARLGGHPLAAIVHRVVHGGDRYYEPVLVDDDVLSHLKEFVPLAPLHQPQAVDAIALLRKAEPGLKQVACFDTAFHRSMPLEERMLPLPYRAWEQGLRRYGFHGLSYEYVATALAEHYGAEPPRRCIVAHLGSGASLCALQDLQSVATTMGFSALDGLVMGTRCGSLDPGALLHFMEVEGLSTTAAAGMLYHESGLLGVSGLSPDLRVLLEAEQTNARARAAIALYLRRLLREAGALHAILGGLDALVFTAGVGEHSAVMRERICASLAFLGIELDSRANESHARVISSSRSRVTVRIEPTNEEWICARHALRVLAAAGAS